jgi:DNA-binding CsgD family transcriptional regulator
VAVPQLWPRALDAILALARGGHGFLHIVSADGAFESHARVDERDVARIYAPEALSLFEPLMRLVRPGITMRNEFVSDHDFARSQAYNELVRPLGGFHSVHLRLMSPTYVATLSLCRGRQFDNFAVEESAILRALEPHLATAIALHQRLGNAERWSHGLARVLDRLDTGVILADATARTVFVNARAERVMSESDGLSCDGFALAAATPAATQELRQAMLRASRVRDHQPAEQQLRLERPSGRAPLLLTVLPLGRLDLAIAGTGAPSVGVFVTEADAAGSIDRSAVADTFRLTQREADVALMLAAGHDLAEIATRLDVGLSTVRSHLKHLFNKTDAHSQAALVALIRGFVAPVN